jgi:hypothetical protein
MRSQCSRSPEQCKKERKEEKVLGKIPGIETYRDMSKIRATVRNKKKKKKILVEFYCSGIKLF